jgi:starvation-inducible DNA-binding protein
MTKSEGQIRHHYAPAGLDTGEAEKLATILQERLSSLIDLSLTLKHIHWNVVGAGFIAVHEMMDTQTESARAMVDEVAERITTLGGVAAGLATQVVDMRSADDEYALGRAPVIAHLGALDKVYERIGAGHREAIEQVSGVDPITEDLLISQTAQLEMSHWFVRAHLSDVDGRLATEGTVDQLEAATTAVALQPGSVVSEDTASDGEEEDPAES